MDGFYYLAQSPPADPAVVRDAWLAALRKAIEREALFVAVCHAFLTGIDPARLAALAAIITAAQDAGIAVRTVGTVADHIHSDGAVRSSPQ